MAFQMSAADFERWSQYRLRGVSIFAGSPMSPMTFSIEPPTFLFADEMSGECGSGFLDVLEPV
jgi:hypothetical protein